VSKRRYEARLEALQALRADDPSTPLQLNKALRDRNNYIVGRAASVVADMHADALIPELLTAFERFFDQPARTDPQCLGKVGIARALRHLGYHDAELYLRGLRHTQFEPTWGGQADSAGGLRGICALALSECPLDPIEILSHLSDALADPDKAVRIDAARAIRQLGRAEGALPLRLRVLMGDESDAVGECCAALLSVTPEAGVPFVGRLLQSDNADVQFEAACAMAQSREPRASEILDEYWQRTLPTELRRALLLVLRASPMRTASWAEHAIRADERDVRLG
jgi:HEAT repeat protein